MCLSGSLRTASEPLSQGRTRTRLMFPLEKQHRCLRIHFQHQLLDCLRVSHFRRSRFLSTTTSTTSTKSYYITTPIFYPNASPHIGHLYTLVVGDVFARYQRLRRGLPAHRLGGTGFEDVHFLAGTDEHGMKIQKASKKHFGASGREREFCDSLSERFRVGSLFLAVHDIKNTYMFQNLGNKALISNTCFMRTTSDEHRKTVEDVWVCHLPLCFELLRTRS